MRPEAPDCAFCRIVARAAGATDPAGAPEAGDAASDHIVLADTQCVAFLDRRPVFPGHTLLVPRVHAPDLAALPAELAGPLFLTARLLASAMEDAFGAEGAFVALNNKVSQSVPHLHIHVVPRRRKDGLRGFFWPRAPYADERVALATRDALREALARLRRQEGIII